jgi:hypothetical protein
MFGVDAGAKTGTILGMAKSNFRFDDGLGAWFQAQADRAGLSRNELWERCLVVVREADREARQYGALGMNPVDLVESVGVSLLAKLADVGLMSDVEPLALGLQLREESRARELAEAREARRK